MAATVVFDTNVLFSAAAWRGNPFQCVELARTGRIRAVCCTEIIEELAEKLEIKLRFSKDQVAETLADYLAFLSLAIIPHTLDAVPRDPEDNAVLECADAGQAQFITRTRWDRTQVKYDIPPDDFVDVRVVSHRNLRICVVGGRWRFLINKCIHHRVQLHGRREPIDREKQEENRYF